MKPFLEAIQSGQVLLFDGAMGTELEERGLHPAAEWNVKSPETVMNVHRSYVDAGADVLITNTLTANRLAMERSGEGDKFVDYCSAGVRICLEAAAGRAYVAGDMSSTGQMLEPYGDYAEEQFHCVFAEQAEALAAAGADLLIIETMSDLREAVVAVRACKSVTSIPVIVTMSFDPTPGGARTMMGNTVQACVSALDAAGADVIGTNCGGITPQQAAEVVAEMRKLTGTPLIAQPNAGMPELVGDRAVFSLPPEEFAVGMLGCLEAGAQLVGGCCGTTPAHIAALRRALDARR